MQRDTTMAQLSFCYGESFGVHVNPQNAEQISVHSLGALQVDRSTLSLGYMTNRTAQPYGHWLLTWPKGVRFLSAFRRQRRRSHAVNRIAKKN